MKSKRKNLIQIIIIISVIIAIMIASVYIWQKTQKKPLEANNLNTIQESNSTNEPAQQPAADTKSSDTTPKSSTPTPVQTPAQPVLTKSSGNNGAVPSGANMNFICSAEPNIDCSIILSSGGKQIVLGPTKVTDNGRGQYFASFYWTSVKGSYKVTAQAKNSQGGVSSSIAQALEVQ